MNMDHTRRNIIWITLVAALETVQILILTVWVFRFMPIPVAPIAKGVVPQLFQLFHPKRDISFYRWSILEAIILQVGILVLQ